MTSALTCRRFPALFPAHRCRWLLLAVLLLLALLARAGESARVHLLVPNNGGVFRELYLELDAQLKPRGIELGLIELEHGVSALPHSELFIAAGPESLMYLLRSPDSHTPILSLLNTQETLEHARAQLSTQRDLSAIYYDPEPARQLRLIRAVLPRAERIGVFMGPGRDDDIRELERLAAEAGLVLNLEVVASEQELLSTLPGLLTRSDTLLAIPDARIITRQSLKALLLTAYRFNRVLIGSSEAMVNAGSLASTHSTPSQIAHQSADWVIAALTHTPAKLPAPGYAKDFDVAVNRQVARSLGIPVPEAAELKQILQAANAPPVGVVTP